MIAQAPDRTTWTLQKLEERALVLTRAQARLAEIGRGLAARSAELAQEVAEIQHEVSRRQETFR